MVTAEGVLVRADAEQNADLFWAARGAGPGFFGVVTRFHLRTLPAPAHVAQTVQAYALDDFDEVMTWLHDTHASVADSVEIVALTKTDPSIAPEPGAAGHRRRPRERCRGGRRRAGAVPHVSGARPGPARARRGARRRSTNSAARQLDDNPEGHRWAVDNAWLRGPAAEVVPAMRRAYTTLPNEKAFTIWFSMAPLRELPDMAFSLQSEIYLASYVVWEDPADDDADTRPGWSR